MKTLDILLTAVVLIAVVTFIVASILDAHRQTKQYTRECQEPQPNVQGDQPNEQQVTSVPEKQITDL